MIQVYFVRPPKGLKFLEANGNLHAQKHKSQIKQEKNRKNKAFRC